MSEIEFTLKQHCNCRQSVVVYLAASAKIVVFLRKDAKAIDLDRESLAKHLPSYAIPAQFITVPEIPLLVSGKINRQYLINSLNTVLPREEPQEQQEKSEKDEAILQAFDEIGIPQVHMNQSFVAAGGSTLNAISLVMKLRRIGFHGLTVERLLSAQTLQEILSHSMDNDSSQICVFEDVNEYQIVALEKVDKNEALHIITESFANLGEIDALVHQNRADLKLQHKQQWHSLLNERWSIYVANGLSFGVFMDDGRLAGISLSNSLAHEPHLDLATVPILAPLFSMIDAGENELLEQVYSQGLPQSILHSFLTAVNPNLKPEQRVRIMHFLEQQMLHVAATNRFQAVLTANAGSVTQQLAKHVFKYDVNKILYANEWRNASGTLVFPHANSSHTVTISIKHIT